MKVNAESLSQLIQRSITSERIIRENKHIIEQPTMQKIVDILDKVLFTSPDPALKVGDIVDAKQIEAIFMRLPSQEGINYCRQSQKLFIITKIGSDNPNVEDAEYNDYWKLGKIYYEGKGHTDQETKGSNLHLYRKYEVFHGKKRCMEGLESFIHVFNRIDNVGHMQYLGRFDVTDFYINEHSIENDTITKTALVFELTPICGRTSPDIDENYE